MATKEQWANIPPVADQTPLKEPIRIRWRSVSQSRQRLWESLYAALESDWYDRAVALRCLDRYKTYVEVRTEEERQQLLNEIETFDDHTMWKSYMGYHPMGHKKIKGVRGVLRGDAPEQRG